MRKTTMFRGIATCAAACLSALTLEAAGRTDARGFAVDCNADGAVSIAVDTIVDGGIAKLTRHCVVEIAPNVTLQFRGVNISSVSHLQIGGLARSMVAISDSTFAVSGAFSIVPGFRYADYSHWDGARVLITDSVLSAGGGLSVTASSNASRGTTVATDSILRAPTNFLMLAASCSGSNTGYCTYGAGQDGRVTAKNNTLEGATIDLETNATGETIVTGNTFLGTSPIITGGACSATNNTPSVQCP